MCDYEIGDEAYLVEPMRGYKSVQIVDNGFPKLLVRIESGMEFQVYRDELEIPEFRDKLENW